MEPILGQLGRGKQGAKAHGGGEAFLSTEKWYQTGVVDSGQRAPWHLGGCHRDVAWGSSLKVGATGVQCSLGFFSAGGGHGGSNVCSPGQTRLRDKW